MVDKKKMIQKARERAASNKRNAIIHYNESRKIIKKANAQRAKKK